MLSVSSMNTLLAILKVTDARCDVILAGGLYHRFPCFLCGPFLCEAAISALQAILVRVFLLFVQQIKASDSQ